MKPEAMIGRIMRELHRGHWERPADPAWDSNIPVIYYEEANHRGKAYRVPLVILRTQPCEWFRRSGCTMCNYALLAANQEKVTSANILNQVDWALEHLGSSTQYPYVLLSASGSFLSDDEIDPETRLAVLDKLRRWGLKQLSFETRAEFARDPVYLKELKKTFGGGISAGVGLESADDFIRNAILNKGLPRKILLDGLAGLREAGIEYYMYIILGKPFLTPAEDIRDTVASVRFSFDNGGFMCIVFASNLQPYTLNRYLWSQGRFIPPSLWSLLAVIKELGPDPGRRVALKGLTRDLPYAPPVVATTCPKCDERVVAAIRKWDYDRNIADVDAVWGQCDCFEKWKATLDGGADGAIRERVEKGYRQAMAELGLDVDK